METLSPELLAFLGVFGFGAAFIDSVVGGGGLISLPALLWIGLPPHLALGTNKAAAVMGALASFATFVRSGRVNGWLIRRLFPLSLIGSAAGVLVVRQISPDVLRPLVVVMLAVVLVYSVRKKDGGREDHVRGRTRRMLLLSGCGGAFSAPVRALSCSFRSCSWDLISSGRRRTRARSISRAISRGS